MDGLQSLIKKIRKFGLEFVGLYYSSYPAYVADNFDPKGQNRLLILAPTIFGHPSRPIWVSSKGMSPSLHNLPQIGELVWVEFSNGRIDNGTWTYAGPLKGKKPEEFRSDKVYGFKSPTGHIVLIDEIDDIIKINHNSGQVIRITKDFTEITSNDIRLTQEELEEQSPLGNSLDADIKSALDKLQSLIGDLSTYATTQAAASQGPLAGYQPGLQALKLQLETLSAELTPAIQKFEDKSHLSEKVKLS